MDLGRWSALAARGPFARRGETPLLAGISGGRTSGMMAALLDGSAVLQFTNTGKEDTRTLDFLAELDAALGGRIAWLEFRPPARDGAPPREFRFAVVDYRTADRSGGPFEAMLAALAAHRASKGMPPLAPWARGRYCTAYLKHRVRQKHAASLGIEAYDNAIGLRADEPRRVARLAAADRGGVTHRAPLSAAGIDEAQVLEFWSRQRFDLRIEKREGNCTGCFLKDEGDLARVLAADPRDAEWWERMGEAYPGFGGQSHFPGYAQLRAEGPERLAIEAALRAGREPPARDAATTAMDPRRHRLVVLQERRRLRGETRAGFSCACESTLAEAAADDE